ncbi:Dipeptidyl aminopeptidase/acylaminoacyl peptidase [Duganella sp. CF517]|uniref:S9 family peptidase n=1 Tax=Duganella sp. CF517 TaxID=1881038 RepID=UPI0008BCC503|nr:prolyl oligopeptidase family serine peptidase [Duganella sp. CF517]SEO40692.1 Dipeptidyl aminopeptidase/acylaminoacyl peptidase [Duganella sp. CF517]
MRFHQLLVGATLTAAAALSHPPAAHAADAADPAADATPPPIAAFYDNPQFSGALFSPSGKYLAVRVAGMDGRDRLGVMTLSDASVKVVGAFADADIGSFQWVNDERLVFTATDRSVGQGDARYAPGLFAIDRDGGKLLQLVSRSGKPLNGGGGGGGGGPGARGRELLPWNTYLLGQKNGQNSDDIYVTYRAGTKRGQLDYVDLQRLNTKTGRYTSFKRPGGSRSWLLDHNGEPRLTTTREGRVSTIYYRDPANGDEWRKLVSFDVYTGGKDTFSPLAFGPDGTLYVASHAGQDKSAVYTFDFATNKISDQPVVRLADYDFSGSLLFGKGKLLGVRRLTDARDTDWLDDDMKAMQARVDRMLPNTVNLLSLPTRPESPWVMVTAYSDQSPARTMLYNSDTQKLRLLGSSHPQIDPQRMARQTLVRYTARDGLEIPAWLTVPNGGGKNLPLVMLVHGGPYLRGGSWGWNANSQFLASRGYAVLEPEFRGSTGFGEKHFRAGWKQWGLKMQDDIADGARWAIARGTADPKRICIAGASYGGYAALMGLINDPDLYRCGINWAGVTDINLLYDGHWNFSSDMPDGWKQYGMPELVGDQVKDAGQLKATSPLLQAARIKQPLLLAYGGADRRVPLPHGTKFYQAVKEGNPDVEWIEYEEEGHGWALPKNRIDFWGRVEKFLDKNIGGK